MMNMSAKGLTRSICKRCYQQVSVQEWQDGQVIREKFYYAN